MSNIFFSVVIPLYNKEKYIKQTLQSILNQTFTNYEIVVVDDGSTDRSCDIVKLLNSSKINLIHQKNQGPSTARNKGIEKAKGKFIAFMDADDEWLPDKLEKHYQLHQKYPKLNWSCSNYKVFKNNQFYPNEYVSNKVVLEDAIDEIIKGLPLSSISVVVKKDAFDKYQLRFNENFRRSEDREMWYKLACYYPQIGYIQDALAVYHYVDNSLTRSHNLQKDLSFISMIQRISNALEVIEQKRKSRLIHYIQQLNRGRILSIWRNQKEFSHEYNFCKPYVNRFYLLKLRYLVSLPLIVKRVMMKVKFV